ncbi:GNAT family N-acetyltransferase [Silicimonas sp. MF1-12-2]|uniref:GNAT family N-acetyltransferase n=1 Tax=Silicimonas sp. MF1-12-2 TaxID=3384793 RepID=UPI0039B6BDD8
MSEDGIRLEIEGGRGRYVIEMNGEEAELTFSVASPTLRIADHTGVPDALRGTGVGRRLMERMIDDARHEGFKIFPLCPFVNAERRKHPEWADVFSV